MVTIVSDADAVFGACTFFVLFLFLGQENRGTYKPNHSEFIKMTGVGGAGIWPNC